MKYNTKQTIGRTCDSTVYYLINVGRQMYSKPTFNNEEKVSGYQLSL